VGGPGADQDIPLLDHFVDTISSGPLTSQTRVIDRLLLACSHHLASGWLRRFRGLCAGLPAREQAAAALGLSPWPPAEAKKVHRAMTRRSNSARPVATRRSTASLRLITNEHKLKTIAFPSISTGVFGYPRIQGGC
jgi:hypothetical protein